MKTRLNTERYLINRLDSNPSDIEYYKLMADAVSKYQFKWVLTFTFQKPVSDYTYVDLAWEKFVKRVSRDLYGRKRILTYWGVAEGVDRFGFIPAHFHGHVLLPEIDVVYRGGLLRKLRWQTSLGGYQHHLERVVFTSPNGAIEIENRIGNAKFFPIWDMPGKVDYLLKGLKTGQFFPLTGSVLI